MGSEKVLITGITGQDGSYLTERLLKKGDNVYGLVRDPSNLGHADNHRGDITSVKGDLSDTSGVVKIIKGGGFDVIYNFGGITNLRSAWNDPVGTLTINGVTPCAIVDAVREIGHGRVFLASSREIFGSPNESPQSETTEVAPTNPYGIAKAMCMSFARQYREKYGLFVCTGIFGNHESPRRGLEFVTRKVTLAAAAISLGLVGEKSPNGFDGKPLVDKDLRFEIGDLETIRDWGHADDFIEAAYQIMQLDKSDDYVIATGRGHTIGDLCRTAFEAAGIIDWRKHVVINQAWVNKKEEYPLIGDNSKLRSATGWEPRISFEEMIREMVREDIKRLKK